MLQQNLILASFLHVIGIMINTPLKPDVERCQAESKCITVTVVTDQKVCHKFIFVIITQAEFKQHFNQSTLVKRGYVTYVTIVTAVVNTVFRQCDTCYRYFRYCTISINSSAIVTRDAPDENMVSSGG